MKGRRSRSDGLLALGILVALVAGVIVVGAFGTRGADPFEVRRSTFLGTPYGTRALHDLLRELGYDVRRHRGSLRFVPPEAGTLCVLSAPVPVGQDEIRGIVSWVESGGTLVLGLGGGTLVPVATLANRGAPSAALAEALGVHVQRTPRTEMGILPGGMLAAAGTVERVRFHGGRVLDGPFTLSPGYRSLVRGPHGDLVAEAPRGRGRVVAFADDTALTNRYLRDPWNAQMAVLLLAHDGKEGPILFDERHQGYGEDRESLERLAGALSETGLGLVLAQAALAALLLLWAAGRRFGAPLPPPRLHRRAAVESAGALGRAYRDAGAAGLAAETLAAGARRRAAPRVGLPPTLPPEEFGARLRASRTPGAAAPPAPPDPAPPAGRGGRRGGGARAWGGGRWGGWVGWRGGAGGRAGGGGAAAGGGGGAAPGGGPPPTPPRGGWGARRRAARTPGAAALAAALDGIAAAGRGGKRAGDALAGAARALDGAMERLGRTDREGT